MLLERIIHELKKFYTETLVNLRGVICLIRFIRDNGFRFFSIIFQPEYIPFGRTARNIQLNRNSKSNPTIDKYYHNDSDRLRELQTSKKIGDVDFMPRISDSDYRKNRMNWCGNLLNLRTNLPNDWKEQIEQIRSCCTDLNITHSDMSYYPLNPFIINNVCVKDGRIRLINFDKIRFWRDDQNFDRLIRMIQLSERDRTMYIYDAYIGLIQKSLNNIITLMGLIGTWILIRQFF